MSRPLEVPTSDSSGDPYLEEQSLAQGPTACWVPGLKDVEIEFV